MQIARLAAVLAMLGASAAVRAADEKPTFHAVKTSTVTSKVKSVDQKTRMVTLVSDEGEVTFKADSRIKNLKQLKPGDVVTATMTESLSARVLKPGESVPTASEGSTLATAPPGQKPAAYAAKEAYVVATVAAIDKDNMIVTLKGPKGDAFPVKAREKKNVEKLAVGDNIEIHATQAMAIEVTTPKK
jgi:TusA-related sulfurtransferase